MLQAFYQFGVFVHSQRDSLEVNQVQVEAPIAARVPISSGVIRVIGLHHA